MHIYVSGVPGVGKSSLCRSLAVSRPDRFVHVEMGRLISEASQSSLDRDELRAHPHRYVNSLVLGRANQALLEQLWEIERGGQTAVVEGRAVVRDRFGLMLMPASEDHFARITYGCIVHLYAPSSVIQGRISGDLKSRWEVNSIELEAHQNLELSVSVAHALTYAVPLYCVDASGPAETVLNAALDVTAGILA